MVGTRIFLDGTKSAVNAVAPKSTWVDCLLAFFVIGFVFFFGLILPESMKQAGREKDEDDQDWRDMQRFN